MKQDWINALLGGGLIGLAVSFMLLLNGRVTGISGTIFGVLVPAKGEWQWRVSLLAGLVVGGFLLKAQGGSYFPSGGFVPILPMAGFLVGFGTVLGSGCTSGHGVCGVSRLSPRSLVATSVFIFAGVLTVALLKRFL